MVTVSSPVPQLSSEEVSPEKMNGLLAELKSKMVELIVQGDEVTKQMWHMYSVFEELFGTTDLKPVADPSGSPVPCPPEVTPSKDSKTSAPVPTSPQNKKGPPPAPSSDNSSSGARGGASNPLLDTIGVLADSDDSSDLDYLRFQRKPEHRRQAEECSVDSGYKSLCATPEVSSDGRSDISEKTRIRMGTRSIKPHAMSDVTLDHLMYLRQSLRKDRCESASRSPVERPPRGAREEWPRAPVEEGGGEGLLSGVEYYDLESVRDFPNTNNYVTVLEERTRCARIRLMSTPRISEPLAERHLMSSFSRRDPRPPPPRYHRQQQRQQQQPATDSKLTEAAIRVLEMIEDFRLEEAMSRRRHRPPSDPHVYEEIPYEPPRRLPQPPPPRRHRH